MEFINYILHKANNLHPNIKVVRQVGMSVSFLDVHIENKDSTLTTSVYHKEAAKPYIVPFKSDHLRHVVQNIINGILMQAIRYSSTLQLFNQEQLSIKLMLLCNGHSILMQRPTIAEYEIVHRLVKSDNTDPEEEISNPLVKARLRKQTKFDEYTIIHYTHEKRVQNNKKKNIHKIWNQLFQQTPVINTRLIIANRSNCNITKELVHRRAKLSR